MRSDLAAEMSAYTAQAAVTASEQSAFDARLCEWKAAVTETRDTYKTCRGTLVPVFEVTREKSRTFGLKAVSAPRRTRRPR